jgi:hypothetical protein
LGVRGRQPPFFFWGIYGHFKYIKIDSELRRNLLGSYDTNVTMVNGHCTITCTVAIYLLLVLGCLKHKQVTLHCKKPGRMT